jgi:hypothetical protein
MPGMRAAKKSSTLSVQAGGTETTLALTPSRMGN